MTAPTYRRTSAHLLVDLLLLVGGVALGIYFLIDDTIEAWMIRLSWAGAIVAGFGVVLYAAARLIDRADRGRPYV